MVPSTRAFLLLERKGTTEIQYPHVQQK